MIEKCKNLNWTQCDKVKQYGFSFGYRTLTFKNKRNIKYTICKI